MTNSYHAKALGITCPICETRVADTIHHVVPRQYGSAKNDPSMFGKRKIPLCFSCHNNLHKCVKNKILMTKYRTIDLILADTELVRKIRSMPVIYPKSGLGKLARKKRRSKIIQLLSPAVRF